MILLEFQSVLILSLAKYVIRIGARYILLAIFSVGSIGKLDHLVSDVEIEKMTQIDMKYLCLMGQDFEN